MCVSSQVASKLDTALVLARKSAAYAEEAKDMAEAAIGLPSARSARSTRSTVGGLDTARGSVGSGISGEQAPLLSFVFSALCLLWDALPQPSCRRKKRHLR